jgi:hypothetical protein
MDPSSPNPLARRHDGMGIYVLLIFITLIKQLIIHFTISNEIM